MQRIFRWSLGRRKCGSNHANPRPVMYHHSLFCIKCMEDCGTIFATKPAHHRSRVFRTEICTSPKKNPCFGVGNKERHDVMLVSYTIRNLLLTHLGDVRVDIVRLHQVTNNGLVLRSMEKNPRPQSHGAA